MSKVIFIKYSPLTPKIYEDCCFKSLLNNGFCVEYWDISNLFKFKIPDQIAFCPEELIKIYNFDNYSDLNKSIKQNRDALFILLMTCWLNQLKLLWCLSTSNVKIAYWGPDPIFAKKAPIHRRLRRITLKKINTIIAGHIMHLILRLKLVHFYDYYFSVGSLGYKQIGIYDRHLLSNSLSFPINSTDYNKFKYSNDETLKGDGIPLSNYIVFIDQYLPLHPDNIIMGTGSIPVNDYYDALCRFFSHLEELMQKKVVIAAHPKAHQYSVNDYFEGRKVYFGKTNILIKNADLVLAHFSTAIDYAILSYKSIILLDSVLFDRYCTNYSDLISSYSERFKLKKYYIEDEWEYGNNMDILSLTEAQRSSYESFVFLYCTSSGIKDSNEILVPTYIRKVFNQY